MEQIITQDNDFNFLKIDYKKIPEIIKDKFVIVLDFDGVVTYHSKINMEYLREFGYNLNEEESGHSCVKNGGVKEEHYRIARFKAQTASPDKLPLSKGFSENFSELLKLNNKVIFILTSRYDHMLKHLESYMKHHKIKVDGIINTSELGKTKFLTDLNANIFVDDNLKKITEVFSEIKLDNFLKKCDFIFFRTTENKLEMNPDKKITEIDNWKDLTLFITKKYKEFEENRLFS